MRKSYLVLAGCALAAAAACTATTVTAPPSGSGDASAVAAGKFVWYDLMTETPDASRQFYQGLLGWKFEKVTRDSRPYYLIRTHDGSYIGGVVSIGTRSDGRGSQWLSYLTVSSLPKAIAGATGVGARLFAGPVDLPAGTVAVLADPQGALLGIGRLRSALPSEPVAKAGHFFWTEYLAADDTKAIDFYRDLVGFEGEAVDQGGGMTYHVLKLGESRAGLVRIPDAVANVKPNWLPYILVDDPAAAAAKTTQLGGTVLLAPNPQARKGTLAIVADPSGAAVALQKWPM